MPIISHAIKSGTGETIDKLTEMLNELEPNFMKHNPVIQPDFTTVNRPSGTDVIVTWQLCVYELPKKFLMYGVCSGFDGAVRDANGTITYLYGIYKKWKNSQ